MKKTLKLKKMGGNFNKLHKITQISDCENYRLRAVNILDKKGNLIEAVDFTAGCKFEFKFKNGKQRKKPKLITEFHLFANASYQTINDYKQVIYVTHKEIQLTASRGNYLYKLEDILKCVNEIANIPYTDIEII